MCSYKFSCTLKHTNVHTYIHTYIHTYMNTELNKKQEELAVRQKNEAEVKVNTLGYGYQ